MGPKLFIMYINEICNVSTVLKFVLFDPNIFCSGDNVQLLLEEITAEICKLKLWLNSNKLSLNLNKTTLIIFGNSNTQASIKIDGIFIERVKEHKFLGITIDEKLSWKPHKTYSFQSLKKYCNIKQGKTDS